MRFTALPNQSFCRSALSFSSYFCKLMQWVVLLSRWFTETSHWTSWCHGYWQRSRPNEVVFQSASFLRSYFFIDEKTSHDCPFNRTRNNEWKEECNLLVRGVCCCSSRPQIVFVWHHLPPSRSILSLSRPVFWFAKVVFAFQKFSNGRGGRIL